MTSERLIGKAREHADCAALVADRYPLRACEHLLASIVAASRAADPDSHFVTLEALPDTLYNRTTAASMTRTLVMLQGVAGSDEEPKGDIAGFTEKAALNAAEFLADVEDELSRRVSPAPAV